MKYKVLLLGRNDILLEDFFMYVTEDFELQTSSMRREDISSHINYFKPDALIYCMKEEERERVDILISLKAELEKNNVVVVLTGNQGECEALRKVSGGMGDLILKKPITVRSIRDKVIEFLDEWKIVGEPQPIPEQQPQVVQETKTQEQVQRATTMQTAQSSLSENVSKSADAKKHILVVDDNPMMLRVIKEQLKDKYSVATAVSGAIALKFLEAKKTDLVLLDYLMPGEDGSQILEKIRNNPATAKLPVVFLTSVTEKEKIKKLVGLKPQGYLLKPIESEVLFDSIRSIIGE